MLDPIIKTIEVPCSQEKAFGVFVNEMGSWWPLDKRSMSLMQGGKPAKSLRVEAKQGGKIVEIGSDDTEHLWGARSSHTIRMTLSAWTFTWAYRQKTQALLKCALPRLERNKHASS